MQPVLPQFIIYVLELVEGKYYVGATKNVEERYKQHLSGRGANWTRAYKPVRILETSPGNKLDEDRKFKEMVFRFGVDNVRGASYAAVVLSPVAHAALQREIYSAQDRCWRCGKTGHFAETCKKEDCQRCGRKHDTRGCHSTVHIDGHPLAAVACRRCGGEGHHEDSCKRKRHVDGQELPPAICRYCGRSTHVSINCMAERGPPGFSQPMPVETPSASPAAEEDSPRGQHAPETPNASPAAEEDSVRDEHTPETGIGCTLF